MRFALTLIVTAIVALAPRAADACVFLQEANTLLGWAADGSASLHARIVNGTLEHAEILPTRYAGDKHVITREGGEIGIRTMKLTECSFKPEPDSRVKGTLTQDALMKLPIVAAMKLVAPSADDGGAGKLTARFIPRKRYAEHQIEIRDAAKRVVSKLDVPVWCVGSCHRDEEWRRWGVTVKQVVTVGTRTLYVVRMQRVCNGGNDKDLWIERVIVAPTADSPRPPKKRCRGSE